MKAILAILGLCIGIWAGPASAGPFDIPDHARAMREVGPAVRIQHAGPDWRSASMLPSAIRVRIRAHEMRDRWALLRTETQTEPLLRLDSPRNLSVASAIPEPSASTLFGVGLLLALQAIPRKTEGQTGIESFGGRGWR